MKCVRLFILLLINSLPSILLSIHPSVRPSARPSIHPSTRQSGHPSVRPSVRPSIFLSIHSSIHLSIQSVPSKRPSIHPVCPAVKSENISTIMNTFFLNIFKYLTFGHMLYFNPQNQYRTSHDKHKGILPYIRKMILDLPAYRTVCLKTEQCWPEYRDALRSEWANS